MPKSPSHLHDIVHKLKKKRHRVIYSKELKEIIAGIMGDEYSDKKAYKLIYYLKNKGHILSIKKNIFYCKFPEDYVSEDLIIEDRYWYILHAHCKTRTDNQRYIGGLKAVELNLHNLSIPDHILIINPNKQSHESVLTGKELQFKKYSTKDENFFRQFKKLTHKIKMSKYQFPYACLELALLESLYNFDELHDRYTYEVIKKIIKKSKNLDLDVIETILKLGKHHTSVNRLLKICKSHNKKLADALTPLIKKRSFIIDT